MNRPSWNQYFLSMIPIIASRSSCLSRRVGAIIVKDHRIISTGYNGVPAGLPHCSEMGGCKRIQENVPSGQRHEICRAVHAEQNAILFTRDNEDLKGAILYLNTTPCSICMKLIITVGIQKIIHSEEAYPDPLTMQFIEQSGIEIVHEPLIIEMSQYMDLVRR